MSRDSKYLLAIAIAFALLLGIWIYRKNKREGLVEMMNNTKEFFGKLLWSQKLRSDTAGDGSFGSARTHEGNHNGIDLVVSPGTTVFAPCDGIVKKAFPYYGDINYEGIRIDGTGQYEGYRFKIFYVEGFPSVIGQEVKKGQEIGKAQDISQRYPGQGMKPHIHVEFYAMNEIQDPTNILLA